MESDFVDLCDKRDRNVDVLLVLRRGSERSGTGSLRIYEQKRDQKLTIATEHRVLTIPSNRGVKSK